MREALASEDVASTAALRLAPQPSLDRCPAMQVAAAIVVTLHKGREASALAAAFNVLSLPAVVYLPPNCIAAVADECR